MSAESFSSFIHGVAFLPSHVQEALAIDAQFYPAQDLATFDICRAWQIRNPDIYSGVIERSTGRLLGYINLSPVAPESLPALFAPEFHDIDIQPSQILPYEPGSTYATYLSSIARLPSHPAFETSKSAGRNLMADLIWNKLEDLNKRGILISEIWAKTITPAGEKFMRSFGMEKVNAFKNAWRYKV